MNPQAAFLDMLLAAMKDAALKQKLTQLKLQFDPTEGGGPATHQVRVIVVPEKMDYNFPPYAPLGSAGRG